MNKKLQKQIKAYAGVAGIILSAEKLNAQVVVTDYIPSLADSVSPPCNTVDLMLDMDLNGVNDFDFRLEFSSINCSAGSLYHNLILAPNGKVQEDTVHCWSSFQTFIGYAVKADSPGMLIDNTNFWLYNGVLDRHITYLSGNWGSCIYYWSTIGVGCLPVKFLINGLYHFGWIRMHANYNHIEIFQSAYQLQPNVPVLACDTTNLATGISEYNHQEFIFTHQANSIHISYFQKLNHANISVYDLLGKEILQQPFEGNETTITLDKKGIYFVEVKSEKGIFRKKVFIY